MNTHRQSFLSSAPGPLLSIAQLQRKCSCGTHTSGGATCDECKSAAKLQRKGGKDTRTDEAPASVYDVLRSRGDSLDAADQSFFESRFGHDFARVRVHADGAAAAAASEVSASAFTVGHHVVFGSGGYRPGSSSGRELLAHELAHVVQQQGASIPGSGLRIGASSSPLESSADHAASRALSGTGAPPGMTSGAMISREDAGTGSGSGGGGAAAKKCPATHTIPDDVYTSMDTEWTKSGHGGATVAEHAGRVVNDKTGKRTIRTGAGGSGGMTVPGEQPGDTTLGTFHTHPYSKSEGSHLGVPFSGTDIKSFIEGNAGSFMYIAAGSCNFALDTLDSTARDGCKALDIKKRWTDAFSAASGSIQNKSEVATKTAIVGCGLCFYKACRPDEKTAIPKTGNLVT